MNQQQVTTEKLFADLQAVVYDAEALLKATAGQVGDKVQEVRSRAEQTIKQARARLNGVEADVVRKARDAAAATDVYVRDNPWQAVGLAAGLGLLAGLLLSRRS
jgi:ElaB/YqjD/DUF883 family membrane-anchored ribosome-binding protein